MGQDMKRLRFPLFRPSLLALSLGLAGLPIGLSAATATASASNEAQARVIVRFRAAAPSVLAKPMATRAAAAEVADLAGQRAHALALRTGLAARGGLRAGLSLDARTQVVRAQGLSSADLARRLAADPEVELVEVDHLRRHSLVPNDPAYATVAGSGPAAGQWYLKPPAGETVSSINAPTAWDRTTGSGAIVVAVLDTGVRKDHPDLAANLVGGYDFVAYNNNQAPTAQGLAFANDGNGHDSDASDPGDWVTQADVNAGTFGNDCSSDDEGNSSWHGTRVAGLIAAVSNNGLGMAGVAWGAKVLPVRVLGKCGGFDSEIMAGMRWAMGVDVPGVPSNPNPARVLNLSLGGGASCGNFYPQVIAEATARNVVVVAAAGNSAGQTVGAPGSCAGVVTVAGLRHVGSKVGFSSLGPQVTLSAPGGNCVNVDANGNATGPCLYPLYSTGNSGTQGPVAADNSYINGVGTSFSAPLVSGTVALMLSLQPGLTTSQVRNLLTSTVRAFPTTGATAGTASCQAPSSSEQLECYCTTSTCGAGMLDAGAAVAAAVPAPTPAPTPTPVPTPTPTPTPAPAPSTDGGGGGGGASSLAWLLGLSVASIALRRGRPSDRAGG